MIIDETTRQFKCDYCKKLFIRTASDFHKSKRCKSHFCDKTCLNASQIKKINCVCKQCGCEFTKTPSQVKKSKNHFCSMSCAGTYNNTHKTHGTRRSKLEVWIEEQLTKLYPNLEIHFNQKDTINSELDIYIPSMKIAFELNGIFHYEPIFGEDQLDKIQNNDHRKFAACHEAGISLCVIDTSGQKYFKPKSSQRYLDIITGIIDP